jgi:hypothetical protein
MTPRRINRAPGGHSVQGAVIVRNNRSSLYTANADTDLVSAAGLVKFWHCATSGVGAHSWSVCFGQTLTVSDLVNSAGWVNDTFLGISPNI